MFHVKPRHYVRTELTVPGAGTAVHIADLEEIDQTTCRMKRIIELAPDDTIMGFVGEGRSAGQAQAPMDTVPHPDTYGDFPDISVTRLSADEFHALWTEALAKFPEA